MRGRQKKETRFLGSPAWMVTYGDMITLVLCFFVALYAFSVIDVERFRMALLSIQGSLGFFEGNPAVLQEGVSSVEGEMTDDLQMEGVFKEAMEFFKEQGVYDKIKLVKDERGLILRFQETVLFDRGKAELKPEAKAVLAEAAEFLKKIPNQVRVEGHTCDLPIHSPQYPSNWELSTARATTVIRYFIALGLPGERFSAVGYGEYRPVVPNTSEANRRQNRRVDILILKQELGAKEPTPAE
jgi:chemotaxis protein MotB